MPDDPTPDDPRPDAVLLDVGGVFHLPDPQMLAAAIARTGVSVDPGALARAHYAGAAQFPVHVGLGATTGDVDGTFAFEEHWEAYLEAYVVEAGVPPAARAEVLDHLRPEFASAAIWSALVPGSRDGLGALVATGVTVGIVSNSDGSVAARLREQEVLQVGPGPGIPVACVIDSGEVGVAKPDPRIFRIALEAIGTAPDATWYVGDTPGIDVAGARNAGLHPLLVDPYGFHPDADHATVRSLHDVAERVRATRSAAG